MNIINKTINFLKEVRIELSKVSWSTRQELTSSTVAVIFVTFIAALFIGLIDLFLSKMLSLIFR